MDEKDPDQEWQEAMLLAAEVRALAAALDDFAITVRYAVQAGTTVPANLEAENKEISKALWSRALKIARRKT